MDGRRVGALLLLLLSFLPSFAFAQTTADPPLGAAAPTVSRQERVRLLRQKTWDVTAVRAAALAVDGRLDEPAWQRAAPISNFYQRERNEGLPATERTEVRVLYDDQRLYVGFRCVDRRRSW
jgi:hypothetical protein